MASVCVCNNTCQAQLVDGSCAGQCATTPVACRQCTPGFNKSSFSTAGNTEVCSMCAEGTFQGAFGALLCINCPTFEWHELQAQTSVAACMCIPGFERRQNSSCFPCLPGHYKNWIGNELCLPCAIGSYNSQAQATAAQASGPQLGALAIEINEFASPQNPAQGPIKGTNQQSLAAQITAYWSSHASARDSQGVQDGLRPVHVPPHILSPSRVDAGLQAQAAAGIVYAVPIALGAAPAAATAFSLRSFYDSQIAPLFAPGSFLRCQAANAMYLWSGFWAVMGVVVAMQYCAELSEETPNYDNHLKIKQFS
jgi:hypothetical protein